jgi:carboxymethylenebutenolidase
MQQLQEAAKADIITTTVEIMQEGHVATGYEVKPDGVGPLPGVVVIQEWWGLDDHIKDVTEQFAREGYHAVAPVPWTRT